MMTGSTRSANITMHPFHNSKDDRYTLCNTEEQHGNFGNVLSKPTLDSSGFGSRFTKELGSLYSFGAILKQDESTRCSQSEAATNSVVNAEHRFVNGLASQIRYNTSVAEYSSSDESQSTLSYEFDSFSDSSESQCSAKSCLKSSLGDCPDHFSETESLKSNNSSVTGNSGDRFLSQPRPLRSTTSVIRSLITCSDINDMSTAEARQTTWPGETAQCIQVSPPETEQMLDENDNIVNTECASGVATEKQGNRPNFETVEIQSSHHDSEKTAIGLLGMGENLSKGDGKSLDLLDIDSKTRNKLHSCPDNRDENIEICANEKQSSADRSTAESLNRERRVVMCSCNCGDKDKTKLPKVRRKRKKRPKVEYEVLPYPDIRSMKSARPSRKTKEARTCVKRSKSSLTPRGDLSKFRRKLSLKTVSKADAKAMIKELEKTMQRVSAEIEELKKLTKPDKNGRRKAIGKKTSKASKYRHPTSLNAAPARISGARRKRLKKLKKTGQNSARRYAPAENMFTFQRIFASPPSLTVRNGDLEPTNSMVVAKGIVPPEKHPLWTWTLGQRPLPGTALHAAF